MISTPLPLYFTASQWTSQNPILELNQVGFETDTGLSKLGDGITAWNSLAFYDPPHKYTTASGTNTYVADFNFTEIKGYFSGLTLRVKFTNANTGASTINLNGFGAKSIKKVVTDDLTANDILAGGLYELRYDGTNFQMTVSPTFIGVLSYFFEDTSSDISTYKNMVNPFVSGSESYVTDAAPADTNIIQSWATTLGNPNINFIPAGVWNVHVHAYKTGGTKTVQLYAEIYKRASGGTETLLGTTGLSQILSGSEVDLPVMNVSISDTILLVSDRLVVKVRESITGSGSAPTSVTIGYGDNTAARVDLPFSSTQFSTNVGIPIATAGGTSDAITASYSPSFGALTDKMMCAFVASAANTTTTPTFSPDGLTAHTIVKRGGISLLAGDIPNALAVCIVEYNLANTRWELINPGILPASSISGQVSPANGGTGINNGTATLTIGANTTITGGGTIELGGFTLTIPSTGTVALGTGTNNLIAYWTGTNTIGSITNVNSAVLVTSSGGVPSLSTTIPANLTISAGSTTLASIIMTSGTVLSSAAAGAYEYDGICFYTTPTSSSRGVSPSLMYSIIPSGGFSLSTSTGVQSCFPTTGDVWTLNSNTTYEVVCWYEILKSGSTTVTNVAFGGTASYTSFDLMLQGGPTGTNVPIARKVVNTTTAGSATSTGNQFIYMRGLIRISSGGTFIPQIDFQSSGVTSPSMGQNSYIKITPWGTDTNNVMGNVG